MITIILNEGTHSQRWFLVVLKTIRHGFFVFVNFLCLKKTVVAFLAFTIFTFYQCNVQKLMLFLPCFLQVVNDAKFSLKLTVTNRDCNNNLQETLQQLPSKVSKKNYDNKQYGTSKKNLQCWIPLLWKSTVLVYVSMKNSDFVKRARQLYPFQKTLVFLSMFINKSTWEAGNGHC